jgi:phosphoglycolate phosphatase
MKDYKTIIFDLDGTLFESGPIFYHSLSQVCKIRGLEPLEKEKVMELIGEPMTKVCKEIFGKSITDQEIEEIRVQARNAGGGNITERGRLYAGVTEMLDNFKAQGYSLCICSNGSSQYVENVLQSFGIRDYFNIIKSRIEGVSKAQLIKEILEETQSPSAIVVGDRMIDFQGAQDAGCLSIGVSYGYGPKECQGADFSVGNTMDIYHVVNKINGLYKEAAQEIEGNKKEGKPLLVGINGVDASGKTTFTRELANYLINSGHRVQIIHLDDFHNPSSIRNKESDPIISYTNNAFNLERIEEELLKPMVSEAIVDKKLLLLNLNTDKFNMTKRYIIDKDTIVLFEGVLLYREPLVQYFDMKIFIDISFDEVLKRAVKRDAAIMGDQVAEKYRKKYIPIQQAYLERYMPREISKIIIDNENYDNPRIVKR